MQNNANEYSMMMVNLIECLQWEKGVDWQFVVLVAGQKAKMANIPMIKYLFVSIRPNSLSFSEKKKIN